MNQRLFQELRSVHRIMPRSFLKWAGGKYKVADSLEKIIHDKPPFGICWQVRQGERYHEPFLGSGSMYLYLSDKGIIETKKNSFLSDLNPVLICTMDVVSKRDNFPSLFNKLSEFQRLYPLDKPHPNPRRQSKEIREKRLFYRMREKINQMAKNISTLKKQERIELASLAIFLNKTCYNGLWRMNSSGEFNTPEGDYYQPKNIMQENILIACQKELKKSVIRCNDWRDSLKMAKKGDLVYLDPPYMPLKLGDNVFTDYFTSGFTIDDQKDLARVAAKTVKRGVRIIASNHDTQGNPNVRSIYNEAAKLAGIKKPEIRSIDVTRTISCKGHGRIKVNEVLIFMHK